MSTEVDHEQDRTRPCLLGRRRQGPRLVQRAILRPGMGQRDGDITDSVSFTGLTQDIVVEDEDEDEE